VSFTFRLFGNMFAGEVVILMFVFLTPAVVAVAVYGLELFVGVIQAFIFAMLTLVFGVMAVTHGEHAAHEGESNQTTGQLQESEA
jgi:F-type H+-transporting ATPase subunit a